MYQITAVYLDSEIAYAEASSFDYAKEDVIEQIAFSIYAPMIDDIRLICINPDGMQVTMPTGV